jgi:hypothetical protein
MRSRLVESEDERAIAPFSAYRVHFVECIELGEKACNSKNSEIAPGNRLKFVETKC